MSRAAGFDDVAAVLKVCRAYRSAEHTAPLPATKEQADLEIGGAAARLRAKGHAWQDVADALGIPSVAKIRELAGRYLLWLGSQTSGEASGEAQAEDGVTNGATPSA